MSFVDIIFDRKSFQLLSEEISHWQDDISMQVVVSGTENKSGHDRIIGIATINLWFMIEDSCGIVLQVQQIYISSCNNYYFCCRRLMSSM